MAQEIKKLTDLPTVELVRIYDSGLFHIRRISELRRKIKLVLKERALQQSKQRDSDTEREEQRASRARETERERQCQL